jgi:hypothetical protein
MNEEFSDEKLEEIVNSDEYGWGYRVMARELQRRRAEDGKTKCPKCGCSDIKLQYEKGVSAYCPKCQHAGAYCETIEEAKASFLAYSEPEKFWISVEERLPTNLDANKDGYCFALYTTGIAAAIPLARFPDYKEIIAWAPIPPFKQPEKPKCPKCRCEKLSTGSDTFQPKGFKSSATIFIVACCNCGFTGQTSFVETEALAVFTNPPSKGEGNE